MAPNSKLKTLLAASRRSGLKLLITLLLIFHTVQASGIFELNLSALTDSYGRDLRLECCAWQNKSSLEKQQQVGPQASGNNAISSGLNLNSNLIQTSNSVSNSAGRFAAATATETCDPTKCQLIIRICVKNYQTQIDPSQCTFGELSAQVVRPDEHSGRQHNGNGNSYTAAQSAGHMSSLARLQQQQQLAAYQKLKPNQLQQQQPSNIHYQRMLLQQLQQAPYLTMGPTSSEQHSRLYHQGSGGQSRSMRQIAFDQPISFPFNFTWPGAFSLVIDAWYESATGLQQLTGGPFGQAQHHHHHGHNYHHVHHLQAARQMLSSPAVATSYDLYKKQMIMQHSMHGWLTVKNEWTSGMHRTDAAQLVYSYRVTCQPNYYGEQCNILCRPRDDVYGHFTCSELGDVICLPGWQGKYCEEAICLPGCQKDQGNCTRPNECNCRLGWQGQACEQCVRHPGCVHGTCARPFECICEEGWGGLLCNEDLNYCTNHQPCKNGALCTNTFDQTGEGSYTCACDEGFAGKNCERRIQDQGEVAGGSQPQPPLQTISLTPPLGASQLNSSTSAQATVSQQLQQQTLGASSNQAASSPTGQQQQQPKSSGQPAGKSQAGKSAAQAFGPAPHFPGLSQPQPSASQTAAASLDHRVMVAYGIIIVCMVILVVLLLLRVFFERLSGAVVGCGQRLVASSSSGTIWPSASMITASEHDAHDQTHRHRRGGSRRGHSHRHHHASSRSLGLNGQGGNGAGDEHDVATLQNHQNIYKSRASLSTDKLPMVFSNGVSGADTCSSSSASSTMCSTSTLAGDLSSHHHLSHQQHLHHQAAALQAQYSGSAHYGPPLGSAANLHQLHNPYAAYAAAAAAAHHHQLPAMLAQQVPHHHNPYAHLAAAHSVHNLSSAAGTYQRAGRPQQQPQPPPPPYTISGSMNPSGSRATLANPIYSSHSATYVPTGSLYAADYHHPASLLLAGPPPPQTQGPNSIYTNNSTYGAAATLAAQCISAGGYGMSQRADQATGVQQSKGGERPLQSSPKKSKRAAAQASEPPETEASPQQQQQQQRDEDGAVSIGADSGPCLSPPSDPANPYGNLQQAPGSRTPPPQQQQQPTSQSNDQSPYYFLMCNHN